MPDRRFEDTMSVEDLLKKPIKEIFIMAYIQICTTNGQVKKNTKDIKGKISWKIFAPIATILGLLLTYIIIINNLSGGM